MGASRIAELSSLIATHTANVDSRLAANGFPSPSFEPDQPLNPSSDESIAASRQVVLEATDELHALMLGPASILTSPTVRHAFCLYHTYIVQLSNNCD